VWEAPEIFTVFSKVLFPLAVVLAALAIGGAVFAAANTVPASTAGEGASTVSGYTITSVVYTLNGVDPRNIDAITYVATAANGSTVAVLPNLKSRFNSAAGWYTCTRTGGVAPANNISCTTTAPQLTAAVINTLDIVITE
jgi:hypothetical protein